MVTREPCASDRRLIYAAPTPKGIEAVKRGGDIYNAFVREHFAPPMTAIEVQKVTSGLTKVIAAQSP
jgi:DNA-binding MarR family transcriptional regulator